MKRVVRAQEMKACDSRMIEKIGVPSLVLMERAAADTVQEILRRVKVPVKQLRVLCVCGSGNNGGDGFACARILKIKGASADTLFVGNAAHLTAESKTQMKICQKLLISQKSVEEVRYEDYDVIIDAMFGIGLSREVTGVYREVIRGINRAARAFVCAVDIPSGIAADTGAVLCDAVRADLTVTMAFLKPGLLLYPGAAYAGEVVDAEIGIEAIPAKEPLFLPEAADLSVLLPKRAAYGNKGTFGKLLIVAGSKNMSGAAYLSARAALTAGDGMVKLVTTEENRAVIQTALPEVMLSTYETAEEAIACLQQDLSWCDGVVCGPGMGDSERTRAIVRELLANCEKPLVLDADALNSLHGSTEWLTAHRGTLILTPHMGEMARLSGISVAELKQDPVRHAVKFAVSHQVHLIMKDARTIAANPDGSASINRYGNSGMATAGSGDVLSGITGSLVVQGVSAASETAVLLHALAGDAAKEKNGEACLMATDLIKGMKTIYKRLAL